MAGLGIATEAEIKRIPEMVDAADAARILGKSERAIRLDAQLGKLPYTDRNGHPMFYKSHLIQIRFMLELAEGWVM